MHIHLYFCSSSSKSCRNIGCAKGGIGYEYCKSFAIHKCHVIASDIADRLSDIDAELIGSYSVDPIEIDVASDKSVQLVVSNILKKYGTIDVLVNNAGIGSTGPLAELSLDTVRRAWEINTLANVCTMLLMKVQDVC